MDISKEKEALAILKKVIDLVIESESLNNNLDSVLLLCEKFKKKAREANEQSLYNSSIIAINFVEECKAKNISFFGFRMLYFYRRALTGQQTERQD